MCLSEKNAFADRKNLVRKIKLYEFELLSYKIKSSKEKKEKASLKFLVT